MTAGGAAKASLPAIHREPNSHMGVTLPRMARRAEHRAGNVGRDGGTLGPYHIEHSIIAGERRLAVSGNVPFVDGV